MKVLFVCLGNAFRSPVAKALLRKLRPEIEVDSAGINPSIPISEATRKYLARENAEQCLKQTPESLDEKDLDRYDLIIAMEPRHKDVVLSKCTRAQCLEEADTSTRQPLRNLSVLSKQSNQCLLCG